MVNYWINHRRYAESFGAVGERKEKGRKEKVHGDIASVVIQAFT